MSKTQKQLAERKHKIVQKFLEQNISGCDITYNGIEGIDHTIKFGDRKVVCETKTCNKIIKKGLRRVQYRPIIYQNLTLGRFKLKKTQHNSLIEQSGWYVFVVGQQVVGGIKVSELTINFNKEYIDISWLKVLGQCYPDWLRRLKCDVYGV